MMMSLTNESAERVATSIQGSNTVVLLNEAEQATMVKISTGMPQRIVQLAKELGKPSFSTVLGSVTTTTEIMASRTQLEQQRMSMPVTVATNQSTEILVLGVANNNVAVKLTPSVSHKAKFQDDRLINELQQQVAELGVGLQQLVATQTLEVETLNLLNKLAKALKAENNALVQRHWASWLQVVEVLGKQDNTLYAFPPKPLTVTVGESVYFHHYSLPTWLFEQTPPESKESFACYQAFWQAQQQETNIRLKQVTLLKNQLEIKLENWLAARTAPKSN
jgi:hypothetical protein